MAKEEYRKMYFAWNSGWALPVNDHRPWMDRIEQIIYSDDDSYIITSKAVRELVENKYNITTIAKRIVQEYKDLIN